MLQKNRIRLFILLLTIVYMLSACTLFFDQDALDERRDLIVQIRENNEAGFELINSGQYEEAIVYLDKAVESIYKLEPDLIHLEEEKDLTELMDAPFNNLSWAYHMLGDNEQSLKNIDKSLLILPNTETEYVNKGNALYGLSRYDEALDYYNIAISLNQDSTSAYYGKGMVYYDRQQYKEAIQELDTYLSLEKFDLDAAETKVYSHLNLNQNDEARSFAEEFVKNNPKNYDAYKIKEIVLENLEGYTELIDFYDRLSRVFPDNIEAQLKLGDLYYKYGFYDLSLEHFSNLLDKYPDYLDLYIRLINNNDAIGNIEGAKQIYDIALTIDVTYPDLHTTMGNVYLNGTYYIESIEYYDKLIKLDPFDEIAYINKFKALYLGKRYFRGIELSKETEHVSFIYSDIPWYIGSYHLELGNYQEASQYFLRAIEINPYDHEAYSKLALSYLLLEDDQQAEVYSVKSLDLYSGDSLAQYVMDVLQERRKPLGKQVSTFFNDNYLYKDRISKLDLHLNLLDRDNISTREIAEVIDRAKLKNDHFTYTLYGNEYDQLMASNDSDITFKDEGNIFYIKINEFAKTTDDKMIKELDTIQKPEEKVLVIDLRENPGGVWESANNILDALLPRCVSSSLIYYDGTMKHYYSDASFIKFKKIYIFVNENTASAAELLTLSLKTYLSNVTIVGRNTFGKEVGQEVFEDKKKKILLYVVSHYWHVKQNNIINTNIKPDIYINDNQLESFMRAVKFE